MHSVIMLSAIMLSVITRSVTFSYWYGEHHYTECHCAVIYELFLIDSALNLDVLSKSFFGLQQI